MLPPVSHLQPALRGQNKGMGVLPLRPVVLRECARLLLHTLLCWVSKSSRVSLTAVPRHPERSWYVVVVLVPVQAPQTGWRTNNWVLEVSHLSVSMIGVRDLFWGTDFLS